MITICPQSARSANGAPGRNQLRNSPVESNADSRFTITNLDIHLKLTKTENNNFWLVLAHAKKSRIHTGIALTLTIISCSRHKLWAWNISMKLS